MAAFSEGSRSVHPSICLWFHGDFTPLTNPDARCVLALLSSSTKHVQCLSENKGGMLACRGRTRWRWGRGGHTGVPPSWGRWLSSTKVRKWAVMTLSFPTQSCVGDSERPIWRAHSALKAAMAVGAAAFTRPKLLVAKNGYVNRSWIISPLFKWACVHAVHDWMILAPSWYSNRDAWVWNRLSWRKLWPWWMRWQTSTQDEKATFMNEWCQLRKKRSQRLAEQLNAFSFAFGSPGQSHWPVVLALADGPKVEPNDKACATHNVMAALQYLPWHDRPATIKYGWNNEGSSKKVAV